MNLLCFCPFSEDPKKFFIAFSLVEINIVSPWLPLRPRADLLSDQSHSKAVWADLLAASL